jgi:hypothetical protein
MHRTFAERGPRDLRVGRMNGPLSAFLCSALFLGCSAGSSEKGAGGSQGGDGGSGGQTSEGELKLDRNPARSLVCKDPKASNVGKTPFIRLSNAEYENSLRDLLASVGDLGDAKLAPSSLRPGFSPDDALGATTDLVANIGSEAGAAAQKLGANLGKLGLSGCPPAGANDEGRCVDSLIDGFLKRAYRRPLTDDEKGRVKAFVAERRKTDDFVASITTLVEGVLQSPQFQYRLELGEDPKDGVAKLTGYEMASRLSYLLWESMPDSALFEAADKGELDSSDGIKKQLDRMLKDQRSRGMAGKFVTLWLSLEERFPKAAAESKDKTLFPKYDTQAAADLHTGFDLFLQDALVGENGGIKKLLTSEVGFVNAKTAWAFGVDAPSGNELKSVQLNNKQRKGMLTQPALMAALANSAKHSPVPRGVLVLNNVMCQPPPPPPGMMIPSPPPPSPTPRTTRERLVIEHEGQGKTCAGCHEIIDNVGFAFENYNAVGAWQDKEDGLDINSKAKLSDTFDLDGQFDNAVVLTEKLAKSEQVSQCFVESFMRYALARNLAEDDGCNVARLTNAVVSSESDFSALLAGLSETQAFRYRSAFQK